MAVKLEDGLEGAVDPVYEEIIRVLQARGGHVAVIWPEDARALWQTVLYELRDSSPDEMTVERTAAAFGRALARQEDFDLFVLPSIGYRIAEVQDGYANWDGASRRISGRMGSVLAKAEIPAISIHTIVFRPDGRVVFRRWSGLDLAYESDLAQGVGLSASRLREDIEVVREGIGRALDLDAPPDS